MSFSHTELSKRFALLAGSLPEFNLPRTSPPNCCA